MEPLITLLVLAGLLLVSAFSSGTEIALLTLNPVRLEAAARRGNVLARIQQALRANPERLLATVLIANNVVNIAMASLAASLSLQLARESGSVSEGQALAISTVAMTVLVVIFGELLPKTLGAVRPEAFAAVVTRPFWLLDRLLTPLHWLMAHSITPILRWLSGGKQGLEQVPTLEEVRTMLSLAHAGGHVHLADAQVAQEALRFSSKDLEDVMTPRVDVVAAPDTATVGEALTLMMESGFSRLPVYHKDIDEINGVLLLKDLVALSLKRAQGGHDPEDRWAEEPLRPLLREVVSYPGSKSVVEALAELRRERTHLAVVVDEHGGTAGIVTLEDILEELVGDIQDESDKGQSADVVRRSGGILVVTGRVRLDSLPELEAAELGETEASTLGGLLMERLGRPAVVGDSIWLPPKEGYVDYSAGGNGSAGQGPAGPEGSPARGLRVTALKVMRTRIKLLRVEPAEAE